MWALLLAAVCSQLPPPNMPGWNGPGVDPALPIEQAVNEPAVPAVRVPDSGDAAVWTLADLMQRPAQDRPFLRYEWVPPWGDLAWHQIDSYVVNSAVSKSSVIVRPETTAGGWLIVWDLRKLAPKEPDLVRLIQLWDALAFGEPYFHAELPHGMAVACRPYIHTDGKTYHARRFVPAPHVEQAYRLLEDETGSFAPLVRADYLMRRLSSTVEGGLYYHFMGFIRGGQRLTETQIFAQVGLNVGLSRQVEGDDRAAMFQSAVTGKPRAIEQVQGAIGKGRITYDIFDEDFDATRHPFYHLLDIVNRARGKEIIYDLPNGLFGFILTDGAGNLVDVGPPNLVSDHRTPEPLTRQLYPMLSCIRCHGPTGGVQIVRNEVPALLKGALHGDTDVFADLSSNGSLQQSVDRLAGLYAADAKFQSQLGLSRINYADAVWDATGGMSVQGKERIVTKAAEALSKQYANYWYPQHVLTGNMTSERAAMEIGYKVPAGQGAAFLQQLWPATRRDILINDVPIQINDPALSALRRNISVRRQDWERTAVYAAFLTMEARKAEQIQQQAEKLKE